MSGSRFLSAHRRRLMVLCLNWQEYKTYYKTHKGRCEYINCAAGLAGHYGARFTRFGRWRQRDDLHEIEAQIKRLNMVEVSSDRLIKTTPQVHVSE